MGEGEQVNKFTFRRKKEESSHSQLAVKSKLVLMAMYIALALSAIIVLLPLIWLLLSSLKTQADLTTNTWGLPKEWIFSNYYKAWVGSRIPTYMWNSIKVTGLSILLTVILVTHVSFVLARFEFKYKKVLYFFFIAGMMIPIHSAVIPIYTMVGKWGLYNSLAVLSFIYGAFRIPVSIFILESFMRGIPRELEECAFMDGCSIWKLFFHIIVPLSKDGIVTIAILTVLSCWNELLLAMLLINKAVLKTLPIGLMGFITEFNSEYTQLAAGIMIAIIPTVIFYAVAQEKIEKGMIAGAIKG